MKFPRLSLPLAMLALTVAPGRLDAQQAMVRAKVSESLPHYRPEFLIKKPLSIPCTDSLTDLTGDWNRLYRRHQPGASLVFPPKLTNDALKLLHDGSASFVITSREMTMEEEKSFTARFGYPPTRIPIATDAIIVIVNRANPLTSISMAQLDAIYSQNRMGGAMSPALMWSDLGVKGELANRPIRPYSRAENTATYTAFKSMALLGGAFRADLTIREDPAALAEAVSTDITGIAYGPLATWFATNKTLAVAPYESSEARMPTQEAVNASQYPMPRLYYGYLNRAPGKPVDPALNEAIHFFLSQEGQNVVADTGLLPGPAEFMTAALKRLER
jgi:phosphate transport system substrate-binding protein